MAEKGIAAFRAINQTINQNDILTIKNQDIIDFN